MFTNWVGKHNRSTVEFSKAPLHMRYNPYITSGYRPQLSPYQCFQSLFSWSNETINIWTHVLGLCVFAMLLIYECSAILYEHRSPQHSSDVLMTSTVLVCFMACMFFSALYHTLNCVSPEVCLRSFSGDLLGICLAFFAVFLSGIFYSFWCPEHAVFRMFYLGMVSVLFCTAMTFTIVPSLAVEAWQSLRVCLFTGWALSGFLPVFHWILLHWGTQIVQVFLPRIIMMYVISGVAVVIYIFKLPEKIWPGRFNLVGSSHQMWHIMIFLALVYWHHTTGSMAEHRRVHGC